jgi:hypothetical protein
MNAKLFKYWNNKKIIKKNACKSATMQLYGFPTTALIRSLTIFFQRVDDQCEMQISYRLK